MLVARVKPQHYMIRLKARVQGAGPGGDYRATVNFAQCDQGEPPADLLLVGGMNVVGVTDVDREGLALDGKERSNTDGEPFAFARQPDQHHALPPSADIGLQRFDRGGYRLLVIQRQRQPVSGRIAHRREHLHRVLRREHGHDGVNTQATLILGGQVGGEQPGMYMIYPLGNAIAASPETPFLQIGESKYGKPILDRIIRPETSLEDAARCALVSLDSTIRSNLSVGMPVDMALLRSGDLKISQKMRLEADTPLYAEIHDTWSRKLEAAVHSLPRFPWEPPQEREDVPGPLPAMPPRRIPSRQDPGDAQGQQDQQARAITVKADTPHRIFLFTTRFGGGFYAASGNQESAVSRLSSCCLRSTPQR